MAPSTSRRRGKTRTTTTTTTTMKKSSKSPTSSSRRIITRSVYKKQQMLLLSQQTTTTTTTTTPSSSASKKMIKRPACLNPTITIIEGCTTPKSDKYKIPEIATCPPAPKKPKVSASSNCFHHNKRPITFFVHPDLDKFFMFASSRDIKV
ncbi:hypothetical protein vseg_009608 [Gypsophila vaccaria]